MTATLYEITNDALSIFDQLSDNLGELTPELEARLDKLLLEGPGRIEEAAMMVRIMEASAATAEFEAERLRERAKNFQGQADRLKKRMTVALDTAFKGKIKTALFSVWTQKSKDHIVADLVPGVSAQMLHAERPDLVRVKYELDREKTVAAWKAGEELPELVLFEEKKGTRFTRIS
jgi:hypothetical protein